MEKKSKIRSFFQTAAADEAQHVRPERESDKKNGKKTRPAEAVQQRFFPLKNIFHKTLLNTFDED
jgi:hypothetical protein